jgi:hypothetical protein
MKQTIITLAALLALTTSSWAQIDIIKVQNYGEALAEAFVNGQYKSIREVNREIDSYAQGISSVLDRNHFAFTARTSFASAPSLRLI